MARMFNSDYRVRCHRSRGDSGQGEAERTNSAIGDTVVDGATVQWEHQERVEDLNEDEVQAMSLQGYETYEKHRMECNAWLVAEEITRKIDDAPVLGSYITAILSKKPDDLFYFNNKELEQYQNAGTQAKHLFREQITSERLYSFMTLTTFVVNSSWNFLNKAVEISMEFCVFFVKRMTGQVV